MIVLVDGGVRGWGVDLLQSAVGAVVDHCFAGVALKGVGTASLKELHRFYYGLAVNDSFG